MRLEHVRRVLKAVAREPDDGIEHVVAEGGAPWGVERVGAARGETPRASYGMVVPVHAQKKKPK